MTAGDVANHPMNGVDCDSMALQELDEDTNTFYVQDSEGNRFNVYVRKED